MKIKHEQIPKACPRFMHLIDTVQMAPQAEHFFCADPGNGGIRRRFGEGRSSLMSSSPSDEAQMAQVFLDRFASV